MPRLFVSFNWCRRGQRGEKVLSEEELGATEARDFAPEGPHFFNAFFQDIWEKIDCQKGLEISNSSIVSLVLNRLSLSGEGRG